MVGFQYVCVRLVGRLVFASRGGVSLRFSLSIVLSWASCRGLLAVSFRFCPCVLLVADAWAMLSVGRLMSVVSRHGRFASLRIALIVYLVVASRFVRSLRVSSRFSCRSHPFLSCSCRHSWREAGRVGRGGDVFVIMWLWRQCFAPVFLIGLSGRWERAVLFSSVSYIRIHEVGFVLMA